MRSAHRSTRWSKPGFAETALRKKVRDALFDVFQLQPKISIDNSLLFNQTKTALELAVVSLDTEVIRNTRQTWIGSTKRIRIHAKYRVKAGFDLSRKLNVEVTDYGVAVKVPNAKILSVEPVFLSVEELRDGLWNKIQAQDLDSALTPIFHTPIQIAGSIFANWPIMSHFGQVHGAVGL